MDCIDCPKTSCLGSKSQAVPCHRSAVRIVRNVQQGAHPRTAEQCMVLPLDFRGLPEVRGLTAGMVALVGVTLISQPILATRHSRMHLSGIQGKIQCEGEE